MSYEQQFKKLEDSKEIRIKFVSEKGQTNWLTISEENLPEIKTFLSGRHEVEACNAAPPINEAIGNLNDFFVNEAPKLNPFEAAKAIYEKLEQLAEQKRNYLQLQKISQ